MTYQRYCKTELTVALIIFLSLTSSVYRAEGCDCTGCCDDDGGGGMKPLEVPREDETDVTGVMIETVAAVHEEILKKYDKRLLPRNDQDMMLEINTTFTLKNILEFDTLEQKFSVLGFFRANWTDDLLTWDNNTYGGLNTIKLPTTDIWLPKLTFLQAFNGDGVIGELQTDKTKISDKGLVQWVPDGTYTVVCPVNIRYFPFDVQTCSIEYFVAGGVGKSVTLNNYEDIDLSVFTENAEWELISTKVKTQEKNDRNDRNYVKLQFTMERRGDFIMFTVMAPLFMLSFLNGCVFLVPIDSGEKGSFAITVFLSYFVFVTIIMDTLPHNSMQVSLFITFIIALLSVSVLLVIYAILQSKMFYNCGEKACPHTWMQSRRVKGQPEEERSVFTWTMFLGKLDIFLFFGFLFIVGLLSVCFVVSIVFRI